MKGFLSNLYLRPSCHECHCKNGVNHSDITIGDLWGVDSFGDSSVILKVKLTTKSGQQWAASREFRRRIKKAFDAQHIEIPFPQVSLNTGSGTGAMPVKIES